MITAGTNVFISIGIATIIFINPIITKGINLDLVFILESGLLFVYMLAIKIRLTITIIKRSRNPEFYHMSHFGKKIYNTSIVEFKELATYFLTLPFTLMAGAYFFVKFFQR